MENILEIEKVSKHFGRRKVLKDVSLSVQPGEIMGFLGPNGAGKTTLIKMMTGLLSIDSGEIRVCGCGIGNDFEKAMSYVGGIIENPEMYSYLSGMENLKIYARMHGNIDQRRIDEVVRIVRLENRIHEKVRRYSLGMRQRLGIAQAILHNPRLLVLDEPTNGLDPVGIKELRDMLRSFAASGVSVFVSSHMLSEMQLMCDRVTIVDQGVVLGTKSVKEFAYADDGQVIRRYTVSLPGRASELIRQQFPGRDVILGDDYVDVPLKDEEVAQVSRLLVLDGIDLLKLEYVGKTLEDIFMQMTQADNSGQIA